MVSDQANMHLLFRVVTTLRVRKFGCDQQRNVKFMYFMFCQHRYQLLFNLIDENLCMVCYSVERSVLDVTTWQVGVDGAESTVRQFTVNRSFIAIGMFSTTTAQIFITQSLACLSTVNQVTPTGTNESILVICTVLFCEEVKYLTKT